MKIHCSAGRGLLDHTACLSCALQGGPPCGYDYSLLRSLYAVDGKAARRAEIHVTDLTGCLRKAWYDKRDPQPEYPHETLARWLGTAVHASLEGPDDYLESELSLSFDGLVGKSDVVYRDGRVLDYKVSRWLYPAKLPYGSHAVQVNIYAYLLRRMGRPVTRLQIQYIDASGPTKCRRCRVPVRSIEGELRCPKCLQVIPGAHLGAVLVDIPIARDEDIAAFISERKEALSASLETGLPPVPEPGYLCDYCPAREICRPDVELSDAGN